MKTRKKTQQLKRLLLFEQGFSLIELLVVMLLMAILLAIAVPALLGQEESASNVNAKSLLYSSVNIITSTKLNENYKEYPPVTELLDDVLQYEPDWELALPPGSDSGKAYVLKPGATPGKILQLEAYAPSGQGYCLTKEWNEEAVFSNNPCP